MAKWKLSDDPESALWDPHAPTNFLVATEDGCVTAYDCRNSGASLYTLHAHNKSVASMAFNPTIPHLLATGGTDKRIKLWDLESKSCMHTYDAKEVGAVFTLAFNADSPLILAAGGSRGNLVVLATADWPAVSEKYRSWAAKTGASTTSWDPKAQDSDDEDMAEALEELGLETTNNLAVDPEDMGIGVDDGWETMSEDEEDAGSKGKKGGKKDKKKKSKK